MRQRSGVKAVSFVSDGESTISPAFIDGVQVEIVWEYLWRLELMDLF